jgi:hypothetical protein
MSRYGRIWEEIRSIRMQLAAKLRRSPEALPTLAEAQERILEHKEEIDALLSRWKRLELEAENCEDR